ncbi:EAL domain-containing protein [Exilibacterium tricleocarpae]|uniref:cyclic-guanylate-specific phosphodiesterase n=1 Tax=Exilibacterium tricleocarpae TaxID=2591008 RepID=A0A545TAL8_9GAMM|nr:EAL domain-containing protein [Exilibacterium tricleocarpae]TQV74259.1 EAL domain-containing protein [Exilibacterium tricleocarpae]
MSDTLQYPRILAVDDIEENCLLIEYLLDDLPLVVDRATSAAAALQKVDKNDYALIIMDVKMPEMDGFECLRRIRAREAHRIIPVIFLTASQHDQAAIEEGYSAGAIDYLVKPFDSTLLVRKVESIVNVYRSRKELEQHRQGSIDQQKSDQQKSDQQKSDRLNTDSLLDNTADGILGVDQDNIITYANTAASVLLTETKQNIIGSPVKQYIAPKLSDADWQRSSFCRIFKEGQCNQEFDEVFWRNRTTPFPVQYTQATVFEGNNPVGGVISFQDISERKLTEYQLVSLAKYDQLTGVANRTNYWELLSNAISNATRKQHRVTVLLIDLDRFKDVNDRLGHDAGDNILIESAKRIKNCLRETDVVCRMGGDEFAVLIPRPKDDAENLHVAQKILACLTRPYRIQGQRIQIGGSIGIASYPKNGTDASTLTKSADMAMYTAKADGRNCYRFFDDEIQLRINRQIETGNDLRLAIENNRLQLVYQPKFDLKSFELIGVEALLRWQHPQHGFIPPSIFVPIAENYGLIDTLGDWCFKETINQVNQWYRQGLIGAKFSIAVNVSAAQLRTPGFASRFIHQLDQNQVPGASIEVELTETAIMEEPEVTSEELAELRQAGVKISVDDFGTGYSSLSYLKRLPLDILKVDRSFVADIGHDENDEAIVRAIIQLAHSIDLQVVAEGLETKSQLKFLQGLNCDFAQGFYFSKPLAAKEVAGLIQRDKALRQVKQDKVLRKCGQYAERGNQQANA